MGRRNHRLLAAMAVLGVAIGSLPPVVSGASYAGQVSTDGVAGAFYLNEAASSYTINYSDGPSVTVLNPAAGLQDFLRPSDSDSFSISVTTHDESGWTSGAALQIGADSSLTTFSSPGGVAVDPNPGPGFGRIYVANDTLQTTSFASASGVSRSSSGIGIYALNSDQSDAFGYGNSAKYGGISQIPASGTTVDLGDLLHVSVGSDDNLYVTDGRNEQALSVTRLAVV